MNVNPDNYAIVMHNIRLTVCSSHGFSCYGDGYRETASLIQRTGASFFESGFDEIKAGFSIADFERQPCVMASEEVPVFADQNLSAYIFGVCGDERVGRLEVHCFIF